MPVRAEQGRLIDRRTVLKCAGAIGLGAALGRDRRSSQRVSAQESLEPEKPSLRQEITTFEKTHAENPTDPDLQQLVGMYGQLFTDTFGVQAQPTPRIQIATPDDLYSIGYNNQNPLPKHPFELTGMIVKRPDPNQVIPDRPLVLWKGTETTDPTVSCLASYKPALLYGVVLSAAQPAVILDAQLKIGSRKIENVRYTAGFSIYTGKEEDAKNQVGFLLNKFAGIVIAQYLADPTGSTDHQRLVHDSQNPLINQAFPDIFLDGREALKELLTVAGISIQQLVSYWLKSDVRGFLELFDATTSVQIGQKPLSEQVLSVSGKESINAITKTIQNKK